MNYLQQHTILELIGKEGIRRYKKNLKNMKYGDGSKGWLMYALKYQIDDVKQAVKFYYDAGTDEKNLICLGLEYGTGVYGETGQPIKAKHGKFLVFKKSERYNFERHSGIDLPSDQVAFEKDGKIFTKYIRGTKPGYMLTTTNASIKNDWNFLWQMNAERIGAL